MNDTVGMKVLETFCYFDGLLRESISTVLKWTNTHAYDRGFVHLVIILHILSERPIFHPISDKRRDAIDCCKSPEGDDVIVLNCC